MTHTAARFMALSLCLLAFGAQAQEAAIRKNLAASLPLFAKIDEVSKTPFPGMYEVRVGGEFYYTDTAGRYLIQGQVIDAKLQRNLTQERIDKLEKVEFDALPVADAFTIVRGSGKRRMALFVDPNCGYCKSLERDLQKIDNVTFHVFLYPVLGDDSKDKSRNIWCAADKAKAWGNWMLRQQAAPQATCDSAALARNVSFGKTHRINGTPALFFNAGTRVAGAAGVQQIEKYLSAAR